MRAPTCLAFLAAALLCLSGAAHAQDAPTPQAPPGARAPGIPTVASTPQPAVSPGPSLAAPGVRPDIDIWVETWYSRAIDIHRVSPDGERDGLLRVVRMFYNFSVMIYAKDPTTPFHYMVYVDGVKVNEGDATWKLAWTTSVQEQSFNLTVEITQGAQTRHAAWAHVVGIPGADAGIGGAGANPDGSTPGNETVPAGYITRLSWKLVGASLAQVVVAFAIVGGTFLERVERMGWSRLR